MLGAITFSSGHNACIGLFGSSCGGSIGMKTIHKIAMTAMDPSRRARFRGPDSGAVGVSSRSIEQYTCKDVMREHGGNRDVTIAFLHGYLLAKRVIRHAQRSI